MLDMSSERTITMSHVSLENADSATMKDYHLNISTPVLNADGGKRGKEHEEKSNEIFS